ncbi:RHS repeat domain-containing protein [Verrucomicrobium spinosum]|uniref:RHS repeat domain-containing protein n=1 Tax=Verrucomicrobium spinosum TaxID=2736 RepID=UPI0009464DD6|nr:RHS repeat-associated core domain-containing protein [Verrucomicrobium spinosum]
MIEYDYDVRNRLTGETVPSRPQDNRTRTYDDVGNLLSVTHAGDTWRDTAQTYDELNRVVSETSSGLTHSHTYDKAYNRLTTTYGKTGRVLTRTYDAGNRLLTQEDVLSGEPTRLTSFAYDPQGNLLVKTLTDSSTENRTFDVRNRVVELHVKEPDDITTRLLQTYEYDLAGNLTALEEIGGVGGLPTRVLTCAYDGTHRLIVEADQRGVDPAIVTNYTYDKADNRISREVFGGPDAGTTTYAIGNGGNGTGANQIASLTRPDTSVVAFTYDLTGTRISRADDTRTDAYTYDVWTRLLTLDLQTPATPGDRGLYEYSYDARTRRVSREELSIPTVLSFQGGVSIQEYPASPGTSAGSLPAPTVEYVRGPDQGGGVGGVLYSVRSGVASLAHSSARGDIIAKVDESTGAMTWQAHYEAFGRRPEEVGANEDRQRANSKDEDPTGLLNEGFRYRDLETGTFITRDPAGFMDGANLYTYVGQNPWTSFDPIGLAEESINLKDALSSGDVSMKEMHRLRLTDQETTQVFKQSGEQPRWTSEKVKSEVGFEPDGFANSYNMFTEAGRLRRANPGKTDDEIAVIESARRNQAQAKWLLWKEVGSKTDKDRFRILDALHDLASVATLPLMVPSAAGTPWVGTKLATQVGRGAPLVSVATEGQMIISNNATLSKLMNYHKQGKTVTIMVNGRPVQVQPGLPFAGFSNTRTGGWTLGDEAFSSVTELKASMLHELHRVRTSQIPLRGVDSERAAAETSAAFQFSKKSSQ